MNQIFRVIWNHATQSWVAVSELTKAHKKASASNAVKVVLGAATLLLSLNGAEAAVNIESTSASAITAGASTVKGNSITIGNNTIVNVPRNDIKDTSVISGIAIGNNAVVNAHKDATDNINGIAIGHNASTKQTNGASDGNVAIGSNAQAYGEGIIAIGSQKVPDLGAPHGVGNIIMGFNARVGSPDRAVAQSIAIGSGNGNSTVGNTNGAWARGDQSIAIGGNVKAWGDSSIAIGGDDVDRAVDTILPQYTSSSGAIANNVTILNAFQDITGKNLLNGEVTKIDPVTGAKTTLRGSGQYPNTKAGTASVAIGVKSSADEISVAVGTFAEAKKVNSMAIGTGALADEDNSVAIGGGSNTLRKGTKQLNTTVNGITYTWAGGANTAVGDIVSFGSTGYERQLKNVAAGEVSNISTDAINGSQLYGILSNLTTGAFLNYAGDDADGKPKTDATVIKQSIAENRLDIRGGADKDALTENNIGVNNEKGKLWVKLAKDLTNINSIKGLANTLPETKNDVAAPTTNEAAPTNVDKTKAASVNDILNAGWNLKENDTAKDFVKAYDTVKFVDGTGTTANVTVTENGAVSAVKFDVKKTTIAEDIAEPGTMKAGDAGDSFATANDVANAINSAYWKVTGAEDGGEFAEGNATTEEAVKAGDKVTFKAGKNIKLKQAGKDFTYSLNPVLSDITSIAGNGTTMTFNPEGVDLGNKKITGVKSALDAKPVTTTPGTPVTEQPNLVNLGTKPGEKALPDNVLNSAATVRDLANMGWLVSSDKTTGALGAEYKDTVKNANEVKFIGTGAATVSGKTVNGIRTITVDVKQPETATLKSENGKVIEPADALADAKKKLADNPDDEAAKKAVEDAQNAVNNAGNQLATAANVAEMINKSGFNLKTSADKDSNGEKAKGTKDDGELINPGATVEMVAGKNMSVKQDADGKVTYATKDDVEFTSVKLGKAEDGKQPVNLKTDKATPADNNQDGKAPTTALNFSSGEGDKATPTQLKGVGSVLNTKKVPTAPEGTTTPEDKQPKLVNLGSEDAPLSDDVLNSAATVRDLANMGWIVGAPENGYVDTVKNANQVDFKGENGISVTGKTNDKGVREITISVAEGKVTNDVTVTKANGTVINGVKGPDGKLYEKGQDGKPDTSKEIPLAEGDKVNNEGSKFVSGNAVATAIQESGWNIGKAEVKDVTKAFEKEAKVHDKVNPNDDVKFVDGQNTVVKMVTVDAKNEDGSKKATTFVKVDVTGLPVQYTDKNGTPVTKVGDKYFTVDKDGNPTTTEVTPENLTTNMVNPAAKPNEIGAPTTLGNVKSNLPSVNDADKNAKDVDGNPIAGKDNKSAPIDAAKAADIAKNAGNNAATVSDVLNAGWNLQNNGKDKDFVKPYDTVNFVDGKGTKAVVETTSNGTTSNVKFDVDTGKITNNDDGSVQGPVVTPEMTKALEDATNALNSLPANAPASVRKAAEQAVADAANNIANVANKVATAQDVANAINKSGFTLTTSANGGEKISGTPEVINPGKKVEMVAGKNMTVKQESNGKVTYATASNVTFDSVQFGDKGPKITNKVGNINVSGPDGKTPTKITGVAPGEISATSKDAINGSQLHAVASNLNNKINKVGKRGDAGTASALAAANIPQAYTPGKSLVGIAAGSYQGQNGLAVGMSRISDNGKIIIRLSGTANSQGKTGVAAGVGYQW